MKWVIDLCNFQINFFSLMERRFLLLHSLWTRACSYGCVCFAKIFGCSSNQLLLHLKNGLVTVSFTLVNFIFSLWNGWVGVSQFCKRKVATVQSSLSFYFKDPFLHKLEWATRLLCKMAPSATGARIFRVSQTQCYKSTETMHLKRRIE